MMHDEPAAAAGACGGRITRQPERDNGAISDESCADTGVATGPSGPKVSVALT